MATNLFLKDIKTGILKDVGDNQNFGKKDNATKPADATKYIAMVLLPAEGTNDVLASSTPLPEKAIGDGTTDFVTVGSGTIEFANIPYTETLSVVTTAATAARFALIKTNGSSFVEKSIPDADGTLRKKYILDSSFTVTPSGNTCNVEFIGSLSGTQTIEANNSFNLSSVTLTFN